MRRYNVAVTALALKVDQKWVDNILSHFSVPGVEQSVQGQSRRLDDNAVLQLAVVLRLSRELGIPVRRALPLALTLVRHGATIIGDVQLSIDASAVRASLASQLADAVEMAVAPPRGRPAREAARRARDG